MSAHSARGGGSWWWRTCRLRPWSGIGRASEGHPFPSGATPWSCRCGLRRTPCCAILSQTAPTWCRSTHARNLEDYFVQLVKQHPGRRKRRHSREQRSGQGVGVVAHHRLHRGERVQESVRDKVPYNLVIFAVILIAVSLLLGQLTAGQDMKIIKKDLGLAAISIFGLFMAVFIGVGLVWKEVEKRSIYSLLSKPIRRQEFIVGKYLGLDAHASGKRRRDDRGLLRGAGGDGLECRRLVSAGMGSACVGSGVVEGDRHDLPAAHDGDRACAAVFHVHDSDTRNGTTFGLCIVGHFDADLEHFDNRRPVEACRVAGARTVLSFCRKSRGWM